MTTTIFAGLPVAKNIAQFVKSDMETKLFVTSITFDIPEDILFCSKSAIGKPRGVSRSISYARHAFVRVQYNRGYTALQIATFLKLKSVAPIYYSLRLSRQYLDVDPEFRRKFNTLIADE